MLTSPEAKKYLESLGITTMDSYLLDLLVEQANSKNDCLAANYSESTAKLIRLYLLGLLGLAQMTRAIQSERAPSGAGRSWVYPEQEQRWQGISNLLRGLDKHGCVTELIPENPTLPPAGFMFVGLGGCMQ